MPPAEVPVRAAKGGRGAVRGRGFQRLLVAWPER
jgi:hypothetical protein